MLLLLLVAVAYVVTNKHAWWHKMSVVYTQEEIDKKCMSFNSKIEDEAVEMPKS